MIDQSVFVHSSAYVDEPCQVGAGTKIWHFCHVMKNTTIGRGCNLGQNVFVANDVVIGNNVKIQNNVSVYTGVELEDDVFCGPSCVFTNVMNPRSQINRHTQYMRTLVRRGATIGANANHCVRRDHRQIRLHRGGRGRSGRCTRLRPDDRRPCAPPRLDEPPRPPAAAGGCGWHHGLPGKRLALSGNRAWRAALPRLA